MQEAIEMAEDAFGNISHTLKEDKEEILAATNPG